jgi:SepF-like predicted cell division protein (DUF552 family)
MVIDTTIIDGTTIIIDDTYISKDESEIEEILQRIAQIYTDNQESFK